MEHLPELLFSLRRHETNDNVTRIQLRCATREDHVAVMDNGCDDTAAGP